MKNLNIPLFSLGDLSSGSHLFPFRTEKLSLSEPMIVLMGKSRLSPGLSNGTSIENLEHPLGFFAILLKCNHETHYKVKHSKQY